jgi:hypothetical protein
MTSSALPRTVATSIWRAVDCHSGDMRSTVDSVVMICFALAWLVIRFAM